MVNVPGPDLWGYLILPLQQPNENHVLHSQSKTMQNNTGRNIMIRNSLEIQVKRGNSIEAFAYLINTFFLFFFLTTITVEINIQNISHFLQMYVIQPHNAKNM